MRNFLGRNKWLMIWLFFLVVFNIVWLKLDKMPPAWDQAAHLRSIVLTNQWVRGVFWGNGVDLIRSFWGYPPLVYMIGGLWTFIVGWNIGGIIFLNTLFLVAAVIGVYKLVGKISKSNKVALLSAIIFSLLPTIGDISRNMLLDLPLLVWVIWGIYFWQKSDDLKNQKYSWGLLIMLVLASLTKLNGFLYFVPIGIFLLIKSFKKGHILVKSVVGALVYVVVVGGWWLINWHNIYGYLTGLAGQGEPLTDPMNLAQWQTWIYYLRLFFLHQAGPVVAIIFTMLVFLVPKNKGNREIIWWTFIIYVIFTVIKNKDFRFTLPLLVPVAMWMGWGLERLKNKTKLGFVLGVILVLGWMGFNFVENGLGWPVKKPVILTTKVPLLGDAEWIGFDDYPVRSLKKDSWPNGQIVTDLSVEINGSQNTKEVLVLVDIEEINDNNLSLYKTILGQNKLDFGSVGTISQFGDEGEMEMMMKRFNYVLVPDKDYEAVPFYAVNLKAYDQMRDFVWKNIDRFGKVEEYQLPNQKKIYLMKNLGL